MLHGRKFTPKTNKMRELDTYMALASIHMRSFDKSTRKQKLEITEPVRTKPVPERNHPCGCGSGLKYKKCCINKKS